MAAKYTTVADVVAAYESGERWFSDVRIVEADFRSRNLRGAAFIGASLGGANFEGAQLYQAEFFECDLTQASFEDTDVGRVHLDSTTLSGARFRDARFGDAVFDSVDATNADLTRCDLVLAHLRKTDFTGATLDGSTFGFMSFADIDLSPFCAAEASIHEGPCYVDFRSVLRSYHHPGLKGFLVDCGVPEAVAEYTIEAARAEGEGALESLMRSTFISYGGPDEAFARRLYEALREKHVTTFFFPETARLGRRIGDEVHSRIQEHDRMILVCSRASLDRPGVRNEIQTTFDREARDGGASYLIPIRLDDYVLNGWDDPLAPRVRERVVGNFEGAADDDQVFDREMRKLLAALKKDHA